MKTKKQYCEENGLDIDRVFDMCVSGDEGVLAVRGAFTGYFAEITDTSVICTNEKLGIRKEIPFADFKRAEFGIGSGNLWLQCIVDSSEFSFCMPRKAWKSPQAQLLLKKISEHTELLDKKEYDRFMGKLFWLYMFK
jgi:hypothetical protein